MTQLQRAAASLSLNGIVCSHCLHLVVSQSSYIEAGTCRASVLLQRAPADQPLWDLLESAVGSGSAIEFVVQMASGGNPAEPLVLQPVMSGLVDTLSLDAARGIVELEGRDYLAQLAYVAPSSTFVNQTSSQIVERVAQDAGLASVVVSTSTIVGQYYQIEHAHGLLSTFSKFSNTLDLVSFLARLEQYDCWVESKTLYFQARAIEAPTSVVIDVSALVPNSQLPTTYKTLRFDRRLTSDSNSAVLIRSWNNRQRSLVEGSYPAKANGTQNVFVVPNLTSDAALMRAQSIYADLSRHRQVISGQMVGDLSLQPRSILTVQGSPGWDGNYVVDEVTREMSARSGFDQSFVARILSSG
jgi:hypothetical protein